MRTQKQFCTSCDGLGYYADHAADQSCYDGYCVNCPIQRQCPYCAGSGLEEVVRIERNSDEGGRDET